MGAGVVIEIARTGNRLPERLIFAAYEISQFEQVWFVLNGISPVEMDRILDPIVARFPIFIPGVLYIDIADVERLREPLAMADRVIYATERFRAVMRCLGAQPGRAGRVRPPAFAFDDRRPALGVQRRRVGAPAF